jgi:hypothetical protein
MGEAKTMTRDLILSSSCRTPLLLVTAGFFSFCLFASGFVHDML